MGEGHRRTKSLRSVCKTREVREYEHSEQGGSVQTVVKMTRWEAARVVQRDDNYDANK